MMNFFANRLFLLPSLFILMSAMCLIAQEPASVSAGPAAPVVVSEPGAKADENIKEYSGSTPAQGYTAEMPAYCYVKKLIIKRCSDRRLEITAEMQGDIPLREDRTFWLQFFVDLDKDAATGKSFPDLPNFGQDIEFWIHRHATDLPFDGGSSELVAEKKTETVDIKKIEARGNKITFTAQSSLFSKYPHFRFYVSTDLVKYELKSRGAIESDKAICFVPAHGQATF